MPSSRFRTVPVTPSLLASDRVARLQLRCHALGSRLEVKYGPARHGDVKDSLADITRARTLLGYEPLVSLEEGLKKTIDWYRTAN